MNISPRQFGFVAACFLIATLLPAVAYWIRVGADPARCLFKDPVCSLTISTYLLCALTATVFIASARAVYYARRTFERERTPVIAIQERPSAAIRKRERPRRIWIDSIATGFSPRPTPGFSKESHEAVIFDCYCLGRSPLIQARIGVEAFNTELPVRLEVPLGSALAGSMVTLIIFFSNNLTEKFRWTGTAIHDENAAPKCSVESRDIVRSWGFSKDALRAARNK